MGGGHASDATESAKASAVLPSLPTLFGVVSHHAPPFGGARLIYGECRGKMQQICLAALRVDMRNGEKKGESHPHVG